MRAGNARRPRWSEPFRALCPKEANRLDRSTLVVAGVATVGLVMAVLDTTIVNVALDSLSRDLHAPLMTIQWVSTGYLLALAVVIPISGWVTERFGSKRTWIASIGLFALGSTLCGVRHEVMPPGAWSCPPHWHAQEHELFHVLEGDGQLLLFDDDGAQREAVPIRAGHLVSRPAATGVAHALRAGGRGLTYLAFGTREPGEVVFYPRSRKAYLGPLLVRVEPVADYWDGEL